MLNRDWTEHLPAGWRGLYVALIEEFGKLDPKVEVIQAKQKFGELRVYLKKGSPEVYELIDEAARVSTHTCEVCGAPGELRNQQGFYTTRCDEHADDGVHSVSPIVASFRFIGGKLIARPAK